MRCDLFIFRKITNVGTYSFSVSINRKDECFFFINIIMKIYRKTGSFKNCLLTSYAKGDLNETYFNVHRKQSILPNRRPQNSKYNSGRVINCKKYAANFCFLSSQPSQISTENKSLKISRGWGLFLEYKNVEEWDII